MPFTCNLVSEYKGMQPPVMKFPRLWVRDLMTSEKKIIFLHCTAVQILEDLTFPQSILIHFSSEFFQSQEKEARW